MRTPSLNFSEEASMTSLSPDRLFNSLQAQCRSDQVIRTICQDTGSGRQILHEERLANFPGICYIR
jgi:hypothetical protein